MVRKLSLPAVLIMGIALCSLTPARDRNRSSYFAPRDRREAGQRESEQRRRSWSDQISTEELLKFLKEHEAELANRLEKLRGEHPRYFSDQVRALKELYGPVIQQMERDPKAAQFSLEKIRLRLKIQSGLEQVKHSKRQAYVEAQKKLTGHVAKLFEVIVKEEEYEVEQMEEWLENRQDRRYLTRSEYRSSWNYLEQRKEDIAEWKKNKDEIIEQRVEKLLQEHPDFPWGS
ncbi:MAG: hypothetical protein AMJ79_06180 [Phycisphaerae bacterium SM23_30]|nr:MAG: hypothetical protein AMJ79_06180 [Phycisphaerae bacterium SM23_30]